MGETAEERERRLRQLAGGVGSGWSCDPQWIIQRIFQKHCWEIEKVREETDVSLVKKYDKGSFKFV